MPCVYRINLCDQKVIKKLIPVVKVQKFELIFNLLVMLRVSSSDDSLSPVTDQIQKDVHKQIRLQRHIPPLRCGACVL